MHAVRGREGHRIPCARRYGTDAETDDECLRGTTAVTVLSPGCLETRLTTAMWFVIKCMALVEGWDSSRVIIDYHCHMQYTWA